MQSALCVDLVGRRKSERAEIILPATKEWRKAARAALEAKGRGANARLAKAVGCSKPTITLVLNGGQASSAFVGPISDWLGIARPHQEKVADDEVLARKLYSSLGDNGRRLAIEFMQMLQGAKPGE